LWVEASGHASTDRVATYQAFALDALARAGAWREFSRDLDRFARASQRSRTQLDLGDELWKSAGTWLSQGSPRRAARPVAYSLLLAADGYRDQVPELEWLRDPPEGSKQAKFWTAVAAAKIYLESETLSATRQALRTYLVQELERSIEPDAAQQFMALIERFGDIEV
jgi:hypothetical protein